MNTTAFGLISAIPLLVIHSVLQNKTTAIVSSLEMAGMKFLNVMTLNRAIVAGFSEEPSRFDSENDNCKPEAAATA